MLDWRPIDFAVSYVNVVERARFEVLLMAKTDLEGNLVWAKQYKIFEAPLLSFGTVLTLSDGYLIRGNASIGTTNFFYPSEFFYPPRQTRQFVMGQTDV